MGYLNDEVCIDLFNIELNFKSNIPVSRVPPRTAPPAKADVSALTQQFEMNAKRNWMDSNGMKWTPKVTNLLFSGNLLFFSFLLSFFLQISPLNNQSSKNF